MSNFFKICFLILTAALMSNCGGGAATSATGGSTGSSLVISGILGASSSVLSIQNSKVEPFDLNSAMAVDLASLKACAVAATTPPSVSCGDVAGDGSFSVTISSNGTAGVPVSVSFIDETDSSPVATLVIEDTSSKDLNGNTSKDSSVILKGNASLGAITLGTDGQVKVQKGSLGTAIASSTEVVAGTLTFDPTGTWYMKAYDGSIPSGYITVTASCTGEPCIGMPITLLRLAGKEFTPDSGQCNPTPPVSCATTDGTVGTADRYALSIWGDNFSNGIGACGSKTGFTAAEARAYGRIHVATIPLVGTNTVGFGAYTYTPPSGFGGNAAPFDKQWMKTAGTLSQSLQDCRPFTVSNSGTLHSAWACKAKVMYGSWPGTPVAGPQYGWQIGISTGGCFNASTNKPVNVTNWATIGMGSCSNTDSSATYGAGYKTTSCTYTGVDHDNDGATPAINLSCSHTGGQFTDSSGPTGTPMTIAGTLYLGQPETLATAGATCASIGTTGTALLAAYRCYAEVYWQTPRTGGCLREYNFNWETTTAADFAKDSDRGKPKNAFITNILKYAPDGQSATLEDEEINTMTLNTGANSSTFCEASKRTVLTFKKISATRALIDLRMSGNMNSTDAACQGAVKDALAGKQVGNLDLQHILTPHKWIFYIDKTL